MFGLGLIILEAKHWFLNLNSCNPVMLFVYCLQNYRTHFYSNVLEFSLNRNYSSLMKTENMKSNQVRQIICQSGIFIIKSSKRKKCVYCLSKLYFSFSFEGWVWFRWLYVRKHQNGSRQNPLSSKICPQDPLLLSYILRLNGQNNYFNLACTPTCWRCCFCQAMLDKKCVSSDGNS